MCRAMDFDGTDTHTADERFVGARVKPMHSFSQFLQIRSSAYRRRKISGDRRQFWVGRAKQNPKEFDRNPPVENREVRKVPDVSPPPFDE